MNVTNMAPNIAELLEAVFYLKAAVVILVLTTSLVLVIEAIRHD